MNKEKQIEFFKNEIKPYVDLKIKEVFDDIDKYKVKTSCILINQSAYWILKAKHLNTSNTEKVEKE